MLNINKEAFEEKKSYQIVYTSKHGNIWDEEYLPYLFNTKEEALEVLMNNEGVEKRCISNDWYVEVKWQYGEEELHAYDEKERRLTRYYYITQNNIYISKTI